MAILSAFVIGLIFAVGLGLGGMTQPSKVIGFLDILGEWDPSLLFVMVGALLTHSILYRLIRKRSSPIFAKNFLIPTRIKIDRDLILGAVLFGAGWGLAGFCPAPAITSLPSLQTSTFIFVTSMFVGMALFKVAKKYVGVGK